MLVYANELHCRKVSYKKCIKYDAYSRLKFQVYVCVFLLSYLRHSQSIQVVQALLTKYPHLTFKMDFDVAAVSTLSI